MEFQKWKKTLIYIKSKIICSIPVRKSIDKKLFITKKGYDFKKENEYLKQVYNELY